MISLVYQVEDLRNIDANYSWSSDYTNLSFEPSIFVHDSLRVDRIENFYNMEANYIVLKYKLIRFINATFQNEPATITLSRCMDNTVLICTEIFQHGVTPC